MKRLLLMLFAALFAAGVAIAEPAGDVAGKLTARTFTFKYKDVDRAAALIKPLLSADGSLSMQASTNALVVTDHARNVQEIAAALASYDAPPRAVKLTVRLVGAGRGETAKVPRELEDVAGKLAMMRYNNLDDLGAIDVEGREGEPGSLELPSGYRADFKFGEYDPASDSVKLSDFRLAKRTGDEVKPLYNTSLNLKVGQTVILGTAKAQGQRAVFIVFLAKR